MSTPEQRKHGLAGAELDQQRQALAAGLREHGGVLLWGAWRAWQAAFQQALAARGFGDLTPGALQSLLPHLDIGGAQNGTRVTELARRAGISKQAVGQFVTQLSRLGYVEQVPDPADARARIVRYTARGLDFVRAAEAVKTELEQRMAQQVGGSEWPRLLDMLRALHAGLAPRE